MNILTLFNLRYISIKEGKKILSRILKHNNSQQNVIHIMENDRNIIYIRNVLYESEKLLIALIERERSSKVSREHLFSHIMWLKMTLVSDNFQSFNCLAVFTITTLNPHNFPKIKFQ